MMPSLSFPLRASVSRSRGTISSSGIEIYRSAMIFWARAKRSCSTIGSTAARFEPTGDDEAGETLDDALVREVQEEVGVTPMQFRLIATVRERQPKSTGTRCISCMPLHPGKAATPPTDEGRGAQNA